MSLSTYDGLKAEVALFLDRDDLAANIPTFISLAEAEIGRVLRRTTKRATITVSGETTSIPAAFAEIRSMVFASGAPSRDTPLRIVTPEMLAEFQARGSVTGRPRWAAVVGTNLMLAPAPNGVYDLEVIYFEKLVPLSASVQSNVVLAEAPDAYLYGALVGAELFLENDERVERWEAKFQNAINQLATVRSREEFGANLKQARLPVVF